VHSEFWVILDSFPEEFVFLDLLFGISEEKATPDSTEQNVSVLGNPAVHTVDNTGLFEDGRCLFARVRRKDNLEEPIGPKPPVKPMAETQGKRLQGKEEKWAGRGRVIGSLHYKRDCTASLLKCRERRFPDARTTHSGQFLVSETWVGQKSVSEHGLILPSDVVFQAKVPRIYAAMKGGSSHFPHDGKRSIGEVLWKLGFEKVSNAISSGGLVSRGKWGMR